MSVITEVVKKLENSTKQISGKVQHITKKAESLECKTEVLNRELEREMETLALLKLREKEYCLRFRFLVRTSGERCTSFGRL